MNLRQSRIMNYLEALDKLIKTKLELDNHFSDDNRDLFSDKYNSAKEDFYKASKLLFLKFKVIEGSTNEENSI